LLQRFAGLSCARGAQSWAHRGNCRLWKFNIIPMIRIKPLPPYLFHGILELESILLRLVYRTVHGGTVRP
jgi:hypothetical protein